MRFLSIGKARSLGIRCHTGNRPATARGGSASTRAGGGGGAACFVYRGRSFRVFGRAGASRPDRTPRTRALVLPVPSHFEERRKTEAFWYLLEAQNHARAQKHAHKKVPRRKPRPSLHIRG